MARNEYHISELYSKTEIFVADCCLKTILVTFAACLSCDFSFAAEPTITSQSQNAFAGIPRSTPVVMLNILRHSDKAHYPNQESQVTGREAYVFYHTGASELVAQVGGDRAWIGNAKAEIIAPDGEQWDEVFLVRYPSIEVFLKMVNSEAYEKVVMQSGHASHRSLGRLAIDCDGGEVTI